eukprot:3067926-Prymnesium_polylepis.1
MECHKFDRRPPRRSTHRPARPGTRRYDAPHASTLCSPSTLQSEMGGAACGVYVTGTHTPSRLAPPPCTRWRTRDAWRAPVVHARAEPPSH